MRRIIIVLIAAGLGLLPIVPAGAATGDFSSFDVNSGGTYAYSQGRQDDADSNFSAEVTVYSDGEWAFAGTLSNADPGTYTVAIGVERTCAGNVELFDITVGAEPDDVAFAWSGTPTLPAGYNFLRVYEQGDACRTHWGSPVPGQNLVCSGSYTETTYDLIADGPDTGFALDIGDVTVWNSDTTLFVQVATTDGWEFDEAHVHATTEQAGAFPVNNPGSPKVGQFFWNRSYDPWATMDTFEFDLDSKETVEIAVHLSVWDTEDVSTLSFVSDSSDDASGPAFASGGPFAPTPTLVLGTPNSAWAPAEPGASWLTVALADRTQDEWAKFTESFTMPESFVLLDSGLVANSDNAEAVTVNENAVSATSGEQGDVYGTVDDADRGAFAYPSEYPLNPQPGANTIEFLVRNYAGNPAPGNPLAVNWAGSIDYLSRHESAWASGDFFRDRGDWSMYFEYTIGNCNNLP